MLTGNAKSLERPSNKTRGRWTVLTGRGVSGQACLYGRGDRPSSEGHIWAYVFSVSLAFLCPRNDATARGEHPAEMSDDAA